MFVSFQWGVFNFDCETILNQNLKGGVMYSPDTDFNSIPQSSNYIIFSFNENAVHFKTISNFTS